MTNQYFAYLVYSENYVIVGGNPMKKVYLFKK